MAAIKVKLVHGLSGIPASHRTTVVGLGLKKTNSVKVLPDTPQTMGMIARPRNRSYGSRPFSPSTSRPAPIMSRSSSPRLRRKSRRPRQSSGAQPSRHVSIVRSSSPRFSLR